METQLELWKAEVIRSRQGSLPAGLIHLLPFIYTLSERKPNISLTCWHSVPSSLSHSSSFTFSFLFSSYPLIFYRFLFCALLSFFISFSFFPSCFSHPCFSSSDLLAYSSILFFFNSSPLFLCLVCPFSFPLSSFSPPPPHVFPSFHHNLLISHHLRLAH